MTMNTMTLHTAAGSLARLGGFIGTVALRAVSLMRAFKARRDMAMLASFDDRMLADIGLTRGDLRDAIAEPLWRDPSAVLVTRSRERRLSRRSAPRPKPGRLADAPPIAPTSGIAERAMPARYY